MLLAAQARRLPHVLRVAACVRSVYVQHRLLLLLRLLLLFTAAAAVQAAQQVEAGFWGSRGDHAFNVCTPTRLPPCSPNEWSSNN